MAIEDGYDVPQDECTLFMRTVEITPEGPFEYQSGLDCQIEMIKLSGNNTGLIVHVYNEGMFPGQRVEIMNADWRKLKGDGLVAIVCAQRQQGMYVAQPIAPDNVELRWSPDAIYYGVPVRKASNEE